MTYVIIISIMLAILLACLVAPIWSDFKYAQAMREYESKVWY